MSRRKATPAVPPAGPAIPTLTALPPDYRLLRLGTGPKAVLVPVRVITAPEPCAPVASPAQPVYRELGDKHGQVVTCASEAEALAIISANEVRRAQEALNELHQLRHAEQDALWATPAATADAPRKRNTGRKSA